MSLARRLTAGGLQILLGQIGTQLVGLVRNFAVARLVSPVDFGIASTFAVTVALLQMISDLALDKMIIQAPDGEDPALQAALQVMTLIRGCLIALLILVSGGAIARYFNVPDAAWAYRAMAIVPLVRGFEHLDIKRVQRRLAYLPETYVLLASQVVGLFAAIGLALWLHSYVAMLGSVAIQTLAYTLGTHILAKRPYSLVWARSIVDRVLAFGWPVVINGALLFAGGQGDRVLIGGWLGMRQLAIYTSAGLITSAVSVMVMRLTGSLALPILAEAQDNNARFLRRHVQYGSSNSLITVVITVPLIFLCGDIVRLLFGAQYTGPAGVAAFLAFGAGIALLRNWPIVASIATGDTKNMMVMNLVRLTGFAVSAGLLSLGYGMVAVAAGMAAGEILSTCTSLLHFSIRSNAPITRGLRFLSVALGVMVLSLAMVVFGGQGWVIHTLSALLMTLGATGLMVLTSKDCRDIVTHWGKIVKFA